MAGMPIGGTEWSVRPGARPYAKSDASPDNYDLAPGGVRLTLVKRSTRGQRKLGGAPVMAAGRSSGVLAHLAHHRPQER